MTISFALMQLGHGLAARVEVADEADGTVVEQGADRLARGIDARDLAAIQELAQGNRGGAHVVAHLIIQAALAGVDGVAVRHRDDIVQREVDIRELAVQRGYGVEVLIGVLVAPHIQGAVVHQDGPWPDSRR